jgi:uncharacterized membrane protein HdeD (DUF308 family)
MVRSLSASLILRGGLAVIAGFVALAWPAATVFALAVLFAVYAVTDAAWRAVRGFGNAAGGWVSGHLPLGLAGLAAGVMAVAWPRPTAVVLALIVAIWAVTASSAEIVVMISVSYREKWLLSEMEEALRRSAPHLAAMAATFVAVVAEEPMPDHEDVRRLTWR